MDIKTRYKYFLARLNHEINRLGHGGKSYIGKNIGQTGAFIGQLLNSKLNKKAGVDTQIAIAKFISGSEERFIEEGRQIVEYGCIKADLPFSRPQGTAPQLPSSAPLVVLQDEADKKHAEIIAGFENKELAIEINKLLIEVEQRDPNQLKMIKGMIVGILDTLPTKEDSTKKGQLNGTEDVK